MIKGKSNSFGVSLQWVLMSFLSLLSYVTQPAWAWSFSWVKCKPLLQLIEIMWDLEHITEEAMLGSWKVLSECNPLLLFTGSGPLLDMVLPSAVHTPAPFHGLCSVPFVQNSFILPQSCVFSYNWLETSKKKGERYGLNMFLQIHMFKP